MKKILLLQTEISAYNVTTYNEISRHYDLTVGYYLSDKSKIHCNFKKIKFDYFNIGPLSFIKGLSAKYNKYDAIIFLPNLRIPSYFLIPFVCKKPTISWSIGFRVSYVHPYITSRKHNFLDWLTKIIYNKCNANIFYMEKSKEFWRNSSLDLSKIFIAPNTTDVVEIDIKQNQKKNFLFVGTLYKGKGLDLLIKAYHAAVKKRTECPNLIIVGDGEMRGWLEQYIKENSLNRKVELKGAIYDETELAKIFQTTLLCISPTQAGLSVPKSMGYGVPFVTRKDSITGGEIYHIQNGINGILYEQDDSLMEILIHATDHPEKYISMGLQAKVYYNNYATPYHMAQGAIRAIEHALI